MDRTVFNAGEYTVSQKDVWKARKRIAPFVQKTPLIYSEMLSNQYETSIYLKLEQLNTSGSFKIRGAANKILSLSKTEKKRGITRSEEHTSELQSRFDLVCRLLLEKKKKR